MINGCSEFHILHKNQKRMNPFASRQSCSEAEYHSLKAFVMPENTEVALQFDCNEVRRSSLWSWIRLNTTKTFVANNLVSFVHLAYKRQSNSHRHVSLVTVLHSGRNGILLYPFPCPRCCNFFAITPRSQCRSKSMGDMGKEVLLVFLPVCKYNYVNFIYFFFLSRNGITADFE